MGYECDMNVINTVCDNWMGFNGYEWDKWMELLIEYGNSHFFMGYE